MNNLFIISCTGKNNLIGVKLNNKFFKQNLQNKINSSNSVVSNIINFNSKYGVKLDKYFSILVNMGPGSYSSIRISMSVAKGIKIVHGSKILGYKNNQLLELNLENIENLIKNKHFVNKFISPIYNEER